MLKRIYFAILVVASLFLVGCATPTHMAFSDDAEPSAGKDSKPIFLMTATIRNKYRTSFQPKVFVAHVERAVVKDSADRINFKIDDKAKIESDSPELGSTYLLRMGLEPGEYVIRGLSSLARSFPINGFYFTPLHSRLSSKTQGIFYLGHVEATIRERQETEFKAGGSIPLIDQAIAGASTGTFDIVISDEWAQDEQKFRSRFPALKDAVIEKVVLPPFDRGYAQKWWEQN